jgi:hypothetical protein
MNIKKILIISLLLLTLATVTIGASYAATSEKISYSSSKSTQTFDKKIVSINEIYTWNKKGDKFQYKISIKKSFQNKYKIKSVRCEYIDYETDKITYITYDGKNKNSLTIKPINGSFRMPMIIYYETKEKIKKESAKFSEKKRVFLSDSNFVGKKANIKLREKGYVDDRGQGTSIIQYQKFDIKTINKKFKIKTVKALYYAVFDDKLTKTLTFKGNGKTTFTKVIKGNFNVLNSGSLDKFQITYY